MQYQFPTLKLYLAGLIILIFIFLFIWIPRAEVDLIVASEPLIVDLEVRLDSFSKKTLFNLETIPARIIISRDKKIWTDYRFLKELEDNQTKQIIVFKQKDLEKMVFYQIQNLLNESEQKLINDNQIAEIEIGKKVFEFHPKEWKIKVLKKDFSQGQATIKVSLEEEVIKKYNFNKLGQEIRSQKKKLANENLEEFLSIKKAKISLRPWFWPQMPFLSSQINFSIKPLEE